MKIGIIGAENSHTAAIATVLNIENKVKGFTVDYVWGETPAAAKDAAKKGKIPNIVKTPREMMGKIDALIVDHRHGKHHLKAALPFVKKGIPTFVDKPFCIDAAKGKEFLKIGRKAGAPVTSYSVLPEQKSFARFVKKLQTVGTLSAATSYGPSDLKSEYGGVFFYGIHQVDMVLRAFGYDVAAVQVVKHKANATGQLFYKSGLIVTMHLVGAGWCGFALGVMGEKGALHMPITFDASPYLAGVKKFCKMFNTGVEPETDEAMLRPVQVLTALQASVRSGAKERVRR